MTSSFPWSRDDELRRVSRTAAIVPLLLLSGCANWREWRDSKKVARAEEKYGPTADTRIKRLAERSQSVKKGTEQSRLEFTQDLVGMMLAEHDPRVRCSILRTAAEFDTAAATAICKGAMEDPDERVRMEACKVWSKRGGPEAIELLAVRFRGDRELDVRLQAIRMLGALKDKEAIPVLARALEDPDPAVQYRAVASLKEASGRDLGNDVNVWRDWTQDPNGKAGEWTIAEGFRRLF